jgi:hypothetical protein
MFEIVLKYIISILQPHHDYNLSYIQTSDTVLINSNFNCGFFIKRQALYDLLRNKYNIQCIYDPCCPYPGIQCRFYYNSDLTEQNGTQIITENKNNKSKNITKVSFMIFRTGSVLIVGRCNQKIINNIYNFLTELLKNEFKFICQELNIKHFDCVKDKKKKIRKKIIYIDDEIVNADDTKIMEEVKEEVKEEIMKKIKERKPRSKKVKNEVVSTL